MKEEADRFQEEIEAVSKELKDKKAHTILQFWIIKYMLLRNRKLGRKNPDHLMQQFQMKNPGQEDTSSIDFRSQNCPSAYAKSPLLGPDNKSMTGTEKRKMSRQKNTIREPKPKTYAQMHKSPSRRRADTPTMLPFKSNVSVSDYGDRPKSDFEERKEFPTIEASHSNFESLETHQNETHNNTPEKKPVPVGTTMDGHKISMEDCDPSPNKE